MFVQRNIVILESFTLTISFGMFLDLISTYIAEILFTLLLQTKILYALLLQT